MAQRGSTASRDTGHIDPDDIARVSEVFALLGEPGRLKLLLALLEGETCVSDLAEAARMSESATSHALRLFRLHGMARVRRSGRMAYYSLHDQHVRDLLTLALEHARHA